jgi:pilus assembly protein CpaB
MRRTYLSLAGGIALAFLAIVLIRVYVGGANRGPEIPLTAIAVAVRDLDAGAELKPADVQLARWPQESVPRGAFGSFDAIFRGAKKPGDRVVLATMVPGEPVLRSKVSGFGARPTMSARVHTGMRAFSIKIDDISGVAGFILPGDRVDILLTRQTGSDRSLVADVIMQGVTVLGIDQLSDQKADKPVVGRTATVEVTPQQAEKLALAQKAGTLSLALLNQQASDPVATTPFAEHDLGGGHRPRAASGGPSVRVRYGGGDVVNKPIGR